MTKKSTTSTIEASSYTLCRCSKVQMAIPFHYAYEEMVTRNWSTLLVKSATAAHFLTLTQIKITFRKKNEKQKYISGTFGVSYPRKRALVSLSCKLA